MSEKDGGAAFPIQGYENGIFGGTNVIHHQGMKLRDYFAAQALMGMHARDTFDAGQATPQLRAALAYIDADAMLAERAKS